ncbi:hypothetical protein COV12_01385 [Candidatus Woesearchaeota archaeon CG10_big_fil_rev_8_21_14_0_10_32_24]|nr:MAG: hypothetical protein COV12_01385 [Candidatus Woesearchaeota archaeon CG10_big_fil_rev_8_21_14_0_10_32_24]
MKFFQKIQRVIQNPEKFFKTIRKETFSSAFLFWLVFVLTNSLFTSRDYNLTTFFNLNSITLYFLLVITGLIGFFVITGSIHLLLHLFKGKGKYKDTVTAYVYGTVPSLLIGIFLGAIFFVMNQNTKTNLFIVIISQLLFFGVIIYSIYLNIIGLSIYHQISRGKALGAFLLAIAIQIIIIFLITFVFMVRILLAIGGMI